MASMTGEPAIRRTNVGAVIAAVMAAVLVSAFGIAYVAGKASDRALIQSVHESLKGTVRMSVRPSRYMVPAADPDVFYETNEPFEVASDDLGTRLSQAIDVTKVTHLGSAKHSIAGVADVECELADGGKFTFGLFSGRRIVVESFRGPAVLELRSAKVIDDIFLEHATLVEHKRKDYE